MAKKLTLAILALGVFGWEVGCSLEIQHGRIHSQIFAGLSHRCT